MKTQNNHSKQKEVLIGFALLLLTVVGGTAWWTWQATKPSSVKQLTVPSQIEQPPVSTIPKTTVPLPQEQTNIPTTTQTLAPKANTKAIQLQPQTYWLTVEGTQLHLAPQLVTVTQGASKELAIKEALNNLLSSPKTNNLSTTIPAGTKLLALQISKTGIHVNLSSEFRSGGGSSSMIYRVAQVLYTASSLDPKDKVFISIEGQLLDDNYPLGGEGVSLTEPLTRKQFAEDFSIS
ncbi:MAG: GerMN domain-containing protein [Aulosira sp. ZfuVER01]|nr:GerMN domain-containing protein [Aulosira sp. ZfuVER01]MDZ8002806.1 GerMN domain-containing protein [Aulosira sp. DedVER01a]MDZ8054376.1 GerMN domain-containing protein [Aulosira sp. ZfuCHP01]